MNVKYFPLYSGGDLVGRWKVGADDQGFIASLIRRNDDVDEVRVRPCILRHELLDSLCGNFSFGSWRDDVNGTNFVHHGIRSLGNLTRWDGVPVKGWPLP